MTAAELAQRIHDELADDYPSLCDPGADHPPADDAPEFDTILKIHDLTIAAGAECDGMGGEPFGPFPGDELEPADTSTSRFRPKTS